MHRHLFIFLLLLSAVPLYAQQATTSAPTAQGELVEYMSRHAELKDDDIEGHIDLAKWCRNREMYGQLAEVAGEILARQPDNKLAWSYMREADDKITLPDDPQTVADLKAEFKEHFIRYFWTRSTNNFLLIYDTTDAAAGKHCFNLEQAYDSFMTFFNLKTVHPHFLEKRLVVILFKDRQDYLRYSKEIDGVQMLWSAGYFSQRTNRATFFDDATSVTNAKLQGIVDEQKTLIQQLNRQIDDDYKSGDNANANVLFVQRRDAVTKMTIASNMLRTNVTGNNVTKTIHEATHELAFNTGIQKRQVAYPFWLSEGLACCFEFEDRLHGMGPASINRGRWHVLHDALIKKDPPTDEKDALTLEHLISFGPGKEISDETLGIYYANSWALFHYLYRYERPGLEKILTAYAMRRAGEPISQEQHLQIFKDAFGADLHALDRRFRAYVDSIK